MRKEYDLIGKVRAFEGQKICLDSRDIRFFECGQRLAFGHTLRTLRKDPVVRIGEVEVVEVDRAASCVVVSHCLSSAVRGFAVGDYVYRVVEIAAVEKETTKSELLTEARARSEQPAFKVGDRVRFLAHSACRTWVGYFATVVEVAPNDWVRLGQFSNGRFDGGESSGFRPPNETLILAPRYEQCGCVTSDAYIHRCDEHEGNQFYPALDALTAGLRALHAAPDAECRWYNNSMGIAYCGCCPACLSAGTAAPTNPAPDDRGKTLTQALREMRDVVQEKTPLASDAQTESECVTGPRVRLVESYTIPKRATVCDDCGKGPAVVDEWAKLHGQEQTEWLCAYCENRRWCAVHGIESGPGITPPPPPVVDEDGEVWATASGEWP